MTERFMTIREMCDTFDVTPRTLRFYESKELLSPVREGQKRLFTHRDRARLKLILRGKRYGFSLEEIRQLLDLYGPGPQRRIQLEKTQEIARRRLEELRAEREALSDAIADLEREIGLVEQSLTEDQPESSAA
ncbi:MerR family DNA-binding transcriptional regulator [Palleronia sp.]|uniref:MerR family transcriptional regulator n=1 Tax=Palleronia sp. TaxID=1940284 RepID=UPI0035C7ADF5